MNKKPEDIVESKVLEYLKDLKKQGYPLIFEKRQVGGLSYKKGIPDIYAVFNGLHIEIECKRVSGGIQSIMQIKYQKRCERIGIPYILAKSLEDVTSFFEPLLDWK